MTVRLKTSATYKDICRTIKEACETTMKGIMAYTDEEIVSSDLTGNPHTCIFDEKAGIMIDDNFVKLLAWYDNEWGYSNKVLDLIQHIVKVDKAN